MRGQNVQNLHGIEFDLAVTQNLIGLQFPDGQSVVFGYTPLGGTLRELEESFVQELTREPSV